MQSQRRWIRYTFAASVGIVAWLVELALTRTIAPPITPFLPAFAAVIASAAWAGAGPGLLSTAIVTFWSSVFLRAEGLSGLNEAVRMGIFVGECLLLCLGSARFRRALTRAASDKEWHRRLMETAAEGIWVTDVDGVITYANPRIGEILGVTPAEMKGNKIDMYFFPEDIAVERVRFNNRREGTREQFDRRLRRQDGSEAWVLVASSSFRPADGGFAGALSMMTDITERKTAERALRRSEERFRSLFENVLEGVYQSTPEGSILAANPMLLRMLGLQSEADFNDVNIARDLYLDPSVRARLLDRLEQDGSFQNMEYELRRRDGGVIRVVENARVVRGEDGKVLYYEGTLADVTEKREIEEQLRIAQEAETAGRLAGAIAQDFSDALTSVSGYAHLILDELPGSHRAHADALELLKAVDGAAEQTRQLMAFSRERPAYSAMIDLNRLMSGIEGKLRKIAGPEVELTMTTAPEPVMVRADPAHIEQIAINLATGAREACARGGSMNVKTGVSDYFAVFSIRCDGCDDRAVRSGLSTIQAIVLQYGGTVTEQRSPGSTLLSVFIPEAR